MTAGEAGLRGRGVVVTRAEGPDGPLSTALRERGARVLGWPVLRWTGPEDEAPLRVALDRLADFDWVVLTSPRAVDALAERGARPGPATRVAAVGQATARAARAAGLAVALVADPETADGLVAALGRTGIGAGDRVLFPASEIARPALEEGLASLGADVVRVTAYRTLPAEIDRDACARALDEGAVHAVTFTSPSAVEALRDALGAGLFDRAVRQTWVAVIGPTTAKAAAAAGAERMLVAQEHSLDGLAEALAGGLP